MAKSLSWPCYFGPNKRSVSHFFIATPLIWPELCGPLMAALTGLLLYVNAKITEFSKNGIVGHEFLCSSVVRALKQYSVHICWRSWVWIPSRTQNLFPTFRHSEHNLQLSFTRVWNVWKIQMWEKNYPLFISSMLKRPSDNIHVQFTFSLKPPRKLYFNIWKIKKIVLW